jgi:A/G-specific adenine glycosylase
MGCHGPFRQIANRSNKGEHRRAEEFRRRLLSWHALPGSYRDYPWRRTRDSYAILVAELLLQRTNAKAVLPVYDEWLRRWPTADCLPRRRTLQRLLAPLGLPSRVAPMLDILKRLKYEFHGTVPSDPTRLVELLGPGRIYVRNAILLLAHDRPVVAVDRTVARVLSRVFLGEGVSGGRPHSDKRILEIALSALPKARPRAYHLALLDFAATVCKPRSCTEGLRIMGSVCRTCSGHPFC